MSFVESRIGDVVRQKIDDSLIALDIPAALDIPSGIALHKAADWMLEGGE